MSITGWQWQIGGMLCADGAATLPNIPSDHTIEVRALEGLALANTFSSSKSIYDISVHKSFTASYLASSSHRELGSSILPSAHDPDPVPLTTHFICVGCCRQLSGLNFHLIKRYHHSRFFPPGCPQHCLHHDSVSHSQIKQALEGNAVPRLVITCLNIHHNYCCQSQSKLTFLEHSPSSQHCTESFTCNLIQIFIPTVWRCCSFWEPWETEVQWLPNFLIK